MTRFLKSIGPAIVVAAVVLGPGSILTSSKVGAGFGLLGIPVVLASTLLMIAMVALAARIGVIYDGSPCDELASRLGRPVAVAIGGTAPAQAYLFLCMWEGAGRVARECDLRFTASAVRGRVRPSAVRGRSADRSPSLAS